MIPKTYTLKILLTKLAWFEADVSRMNEAGLNTGLYSAYSVTVVTIVIKILEIKVL